MHLRDMGNAIKFKLLNVFEEQWVGSFVIFKHWFKRFHCVLRSNWPRAFRTKHTRLNNNQLLLANHLTSSVFVFQHGAAAKHWFLPLKWTSHFFGQAYPESTHFGLFGLPSALPTQTSPKRIVDILKFVLVWVAYNRRMFLCLVLWKLMSWGCRIYLTKYFNYWSERLESRSSLVAVNNLLEEI